MPEFTVAIEMQIIADDEDHAAALAYKAIKNNPPPLYYSVTNSDGLSKDVVVDATAAEWFGELDDFEKVAGGIIGLFDHKK